MNSTVTEGTAEVAKEPVKLPVSAHLLCGWPLLLVAIGGAVGGGLGGAAYAVNVAIYKSELAVPLKVAANLFVGFAAVAIWLAVALAFQSYRQ